MADQEQTPAVPVVDKPEIASRPAFLKDVRNGLLHVVKVVWQVPAARGYIATLLVRFGVPTALAGVVTLIVDGLLK
jgi:hypothetical protein